MVLTAIAVAIAGLGTIAAAMAIMANWDEVKKWFRDFIKALVGIFTTVGRGAWHAAGAFVDVVKKGFADIMHKLYYQEGNHYVEEIRTREMPENKLPDWVQRKLNQNRGEVDVTPEMERELEMTI